jgi:hypothetical protein
MFKVPYFSKNTNKDFYLYKKLECLKYPKLTENTPFNDFRLTNISEVEYQVDIDY